LDQVEAYLLEEVHLLDQIEGLHLVEAYFLEA
jgi:hypothetical protein